MKNKNTEAQKLKEINVGYPPFSDLKAVLPEEIKINKISPQKLMNKPRRIDELLEMALFNPIGSPKLNQIIKKRSESCGKTTSELSLLFAVDDITRVTPIRKIMPHLLNYLGDCGITGPQIKTLIALGSHRQMTDDELLEKFGDKIIDNIQIKQHQWTDEKLMTNYGTTESGIQVLINKQIEKSDFVLAIGNIVPHEVAGFSGGYKMLIPGLSTLKTVERVHWLSTNQSFQKRLGNNQTLARKQINQAGRLTQLDFIINTVIDADGDVVGIYAGDPIMAQQKGAEFSKTLYSVEAEPAEIVITDCVPEKTDLWTAAKAIIHTAGFVKKGGIMIVAAACPEGVCPTHPQILEMGYKSPQDLENRYLKNKKKNFNRLTATHCANMWEIKQHCEVYLVSRGITAEASENLGLRVFKDLQVAIDHALQIKTSIRQINLIERGSEVIPAFHSPK